jgi:hypothetical protein
MMRLTLWPVALVLLLAGSAAATNADSIHTAGNVFLQTPGARADGLGGCGTLLGEANSGLLNPAAQVLMEDVAASIYYNPRPYFAKGRGLLVLSAAAHSDFGYSGFSYLSQAGFSSSQDVSLRPEEATALLLAGRAWRNLAVGLSFKILTTQKNGFTDLGGTLTKTYKMAFDLGVIYHGLLPQTTLGHVDPEQDDLRRRFGIKYLPGLSFGVAFQNLGGSVGYANNTGENLDPHPLPQSFRADMAWGVFRDRWVELRLLGEEQKILVQKDPMTGAYKGAGYALFHAWGSGNLEGSWISRLGVEATVMCLLSLRAGWSVDHGEGRAFNHAGLGLGPQWLRADLAWIHEPGSDFTWLNGFRMDVSANVTYERIRHWMKKD